MATPDSPPPRRAAPAWVALLSAWVGLLTLILSLALPLLPGSQNPRAELERQQPYSMADRFIPWPIYLSVVGMFLGIVVLRQIWLMPRPLPGPLAAQRVQALVGITLSLLGAAAIYVFVAMAGPR